MTWEIFGRLLLSHRSVPSVASVISRTIARERSTVTLSRTLIGHRERHVSLVAQLFKDPDVQVLTTSR
jgi:hypothetical protein